MITNYKELALPPSKMIHINAGRTTIYQSPISGMIDYQTFEQSDWFDREDMAEEWGSKINSDVRRKVSLHAYTVDIRKKTKIMHKDSFNESVSYWRTGNPIEGLCSSTPKVKIYLERKRELMPGTLSFADAIDLLFDIDCRNDEDEGVFTKRLKKAIASNEIVKEINDASLARLEPLTDFYKEIKKFEEENYTSSDYNLGKSMSCSPLYLVFLLIEFMTMFSRDKFDEYFDCHPGLFVGELLKKQLVPEREVAYCWAETINATKPGKYFTWAEMVRSSTAVRHDIDNEIDTYDIAILCNLVQLCVVLDAVREKYGPLIPKSVYRSPELNKAVNGAKRSRHMLGLAADIEIAGVPNWELGDFLRDVVCKEVAQIEQVILEFSDLVNPASGWVHVQLPETQMPQTFAIAGIIDRKGYRYADSGVKGFQKTVDAFAKNGDE